MLRPSELFLRELPPPDEGQWTLRAVAAGARHMAFLTAEGHLILVGSNKHGQVGQPLHGQEVLETQPFFYDMGFPPEEQPDNIVCGSNYNLAYRAGTRHAVAIGSNTFGQLGVGNKDTHDNTCGFVEWDANASWWHGTKAGIKKVACGYNHTLILLEDGSVFSCGSNLTGELGIGNDTSPMVPTPISYFAENDIHVHDLVAGNAFSLFLAEDGRVFGCGTSRQAALPFNSVVPKLVPVIRPGGTLLMRVKKIGCSGDAVCFVTYKNEVFFRGKLPNYGVEMRGEMLQVFPPKPKAGGENVASGDLVVEHVVGRGESMFLALRDGAIWGFGGNGEGQIHVSEGAMNLAQGVYRESFLPILRASVQCIEQSPDFPSQVAVGHGFVVMLDPHHAYEAMPPRPGRSPQRSGLHVGAQPAAQKIYFPYDAHRQQRRIFF